MKISKSAARIGSLLGRLPGVLPAVHGAAIGGMLALSAFAPAAHAVPTVSSAANIVVPVTSAGIYINVVTGAAGPAATTTGWDINPWGSGSPFLWSATTGGVVTAPLSPVAALTVGSLVDASSSYASQGSAASFGAGAGQWTLNATNYFGFSFIGEDTLLHYGYGTMIVGATALTRTVGRLVYESAPGAGITVAAVPEASTTAMMLAGGGLLAAAALRRRRQGAV